MIGRYEESPIYKLYEALYNEFTMEENSDNKSSIDPLLKLLLINNGCKINEEVEPTQNNITIIPNKLEIYFIANMIGNDANEYYDFLIFNGKKIIVIFTDYFQFVTIKDLDPEDPMYELRMAIGNTIYYNAIKKIVEIFYLISEPMPGGLLTTTMVTTQRWNQAIIAANIINEFKPIDENDICDIPINEVKEMLNKDVRLQLYGIRAIV